MSLQSIESGIYRVGGLHTAAIPGETIERMQRSLAEILNEKKERDSIINPRKAENGFFPMRTFFRDAEEFLDTWIEGYREWETQFGENKSYNKMGFELHYVNWDKESNFYSIPKEDSPFNHEWISLNRLNPLLICADANELYDQRGYMNLWVNDFQSKQALVYRWKREENKIPYSEVSRHDFEKELRNDISYYVWDEKEFFPFSSANPIKANKNVWHMIGISPLDIYQKLEDLNFKFPESN